MAPKTKFTKEQIIDAAFEIARTEGIDSITIRKVASSLGSSIAPIYVNFKHVEELIEAVIHKTFDVSNQILMEQNSGNPFLDAGIASLRFARQYNILFRDLWIAKNIQKGDPEQQLGVVLEMMRQDPELYGFSDEELKQIMLKMRIFQLGLSIMVANDGFSLQLTEDQEIELLKSAGEDVIAAARIRKNNSTVQ